jgi:hypothetical protein
MHGIDLPEKSRRQESNQIPELKYELFQPALRARKMRTGSSESQEKQGRIQKKCATVADEPPHAEILQT